MKQYQWPYAWRARVCVDVRITRFTPRFKYIRDERGYDEEAHIEDISSLPLTIIDVVDDPKEKF